MVKKMNHDVLLNEGSAIPSTKRRAWAEVSLDAVEYNFNCIRACTDSKICCVIKANAYGHGAVQLAGLYESLGADYLAVSNIEEALQLRENNITLPILILGYTSPECAKILAEKNITQCLFSYECGAELARVASEENVRVKVHVKLDTGMGRIGFLCGDNNEVDAACELCKHPSLDTEGVFMHFATADEGENGEEYTREQLRKFVNAIEVFKKSGIEFKIRHCANSAAIFDYPEFHLDMVRAGVVLYGLKPSCQVRNLPKLKSVMALRSVISHIKEIDAGYSISYGRAYVTSEKKMIATVPIGYADGFRRMNGQGKYSLCINGSAAEIVGRVCMDQLMVDVTGIECKAGDAVTVFCGEEPFTVDKIAEINNTINYEIVCDVGERIPRAFVKDGRIVEWKDSILGI